MTVSRISKIILGAYVIGALVALAYSRLNRPPLLRFG